MPELTATATARPAPADTPTATPVPIPPAVELTAPAAPDSLLPQDPVAVHFNQAMDADSVQIPLLFSPLVAGTLTWDASRTTLSFAPLEGFAPDTTYRLVLDESLATADGQHFAELQQWELTILPAPQVVRRNPSQRTLTLRRPEIQLVFDQAMNQTSVADALWVEPAISLALKWQEKTLTIVPQEALEPGVTYQFSLGTDSASSDGVRLVDEFRWSYQTKPLINKIRTPSQDDRQAPITIEFNYAMDTQSVQEALAFEPALVGDVSWDAAGRIATFAPGAPLPTGATYTLAFRGGLKDANNDPLPGPEPYEFETPAPILRALPQRSDVNPALTIQVTFSGCRWTRRQPARP